MADGPVCARCKVTSSLMWEKNKEGEVLCLECHSNSIQDPAAAATSTDQPAPSNREEALSAGFTGRRTRLRNAKGRYGKMHDKTKNNGSHTPASSTSPAPVPTSTNLSPPVTSANVPRKGGVANGRRSLLKVGKPTKAPTLVANVVTSDIILHKGTKYEVGDIVSILDESGRVYYALLRGFLEDQYAVKYAVITWLIPTSPDPKCFDPSTFVLGPEEDTPKDMECLDFVSHSPQSASFLNSLTQDSDVARLWTGKKRRRIMFTS